MGFSFRPEGSGRLSQRSSRRSAARRARDINSYFNQLGGGLGHMIPPQVSSTARKPLSVAFEEISSDKILWGEPVEEVAEVDLPVGEGFETDAEAAD